MNRDYYSEQVTSKTETFEIPEEASEVAADRIEDLMAYIKSHRSERLRLPDLAKRMYITPNYLAAVFKKYSGITVMEYAEEQRMIYARYALKYSRTRISKIALDSGYTSESYFCKVFKKHYGVTPRQWRNICISSMLHDEADQIRSLSDSNDSSHKGPGRNEF